jgi:hypothetical protein
MDPYEMVPGPVFGADQNADTYLMSVASPLGVSRDQTVLVRDFREMRIHRFSSGGDHLGAFGARGAGPGEYQRLNPPAFDGTLLYVVDHSNSRLTVVEAEGQVTQMTRLQGGEFQGWRFTVFGPLESRSFMTIEGSTSRDPETMVPRFRQLEIRLLNPSLELVSIPVSEVQDRPWTILRGDPSLQVIPPFENISAIVALAPDRPVAWSFGEEFKVDCYDPLTDQRWAFQIPHKAQSVTDEMIEDYLETWATRGLIQVARREIKFPRHLPHIQTMLWDDEGRLWVQEYTSPETDFETFRFQVFSEGGEWLFQQDLVIVPSLIANDAIFAGSVDEDGNPVVSSYGLTER